MIVVHNYPIWLPQTQTWLYNQVRYLPGTVESHVVCEALENLDQFLLPNIHSLSEVSRPRYYWEKGLRRIGVRRYLSFLVQVCRRQRADVLHSHFGDVGWRNVGAAKRASLKHVVTFYGYDVGRLPRSDGRWYGRYRTLFRSVDRVLCEGPHMARRVASLGCPEHKVRVHRLGIRVDEIAFRPRTWDPAEPLRVLIAASFQEKKGIPYALEALGRLQHEIPLEITIIGDANKETRSQAEKRRIAATIEKYDLQSKVCILGYQPHDVFFEEAYEHHVFISPSITASDGDTEGGAPVSIIEMAASGIPIISTRHCDIPEIVQDGVTGLLADEGDIEGLVAHLRRLAEHPQQWRGMLEEGRKHVESHHNAVDQARELERVYEGVLS